MGRGPFDFSAGSSPASVRSSWASVSAGAGVRVLAVPSWASISLLSFWA